MTQEAGVVRDAAGLGRLLGVLDGLEASHGDAPPLVAARLIAEASLARPLSLGAHFRSDGEADPAPRRTFVNLVHPETRVAAE